MLDQFWSGARIGCSKLLGIFGTVDGILDHGIERGILAVAVSVRGALRSNAFLTA